jgi:hypothetical protein
MVGEESILLIVFPGVVVAAIFKIESCVHASLITRMIATTSAQISSTA